jgi:hypothetical protein
MVHATSGIGKSEVRHAKNAAGAPQDAAGFRFRNLNGAILMERFRRENLQARYGIGGREINFLTALVSFTRRWRVVGSGAEARIDSDEAFPSQAALARMMGVRSVGTVNKAAKACEAAGLLRVNRSASPVFNKQTGRTENPSNRYTVTLLASEVCADAVETVAAVAGENPLALVRETGEKVPAEVPAAARDRDTEATERDTEPHGMRFGTARDAVEVSGTSSASRVSSSSRGDAAKEEEDVPLCLSDGRTITSAKRSGGKYGGFLSDGRRFGCDEATMAALRAGAAVEAREQKGGYLWLVEAAQGRSRDAEGLRESRTSDCGTRLLLRPNECRIERDDAEGCWLFYFNGTESPVGFTDDEQMARLFTDRNALVAESSRGERCGAWNAWRKASNGDANGEVALGKPRSADAAAERPRRASWAS